jgi:glyoxylase-like metal-dependent hydrolase (beta-lactamase superfamily II)
MRQIRIGEVTIASIIERDGPWRPIRNMFPNADVDLARRYLAEMEPFLYDAASDKLILPYQTFVVRTPRHTILIDTCTGEHKNHPAPWDFSPQPWHDGFTALGLRYTDIDYVFCTHLHIDHTGWNTKLVDGRWMPTFPNAKYIFHKSEYAFWENDALTGANSHGDNGAVWRMNCRPVVEAGQALLVDESYALDDTLFLSLAPGHTPYHCCVHIRSQGQEAIVLGDMMHHALQCREPDWSSGFDTDPVQSAKTRWKFFGEYAGSGILMLPIHFPHPTAGRIDADGKTFRYRFAE